MYSIDKLDFSAKNCQIEPYGEGVMVTVTDPDIEDIISTIGIHAFAKYFGIDLTGGLDDDTVLSVTDDDGRHHNDYEVEDWEL